MSDITAGYKIPMSLGDLMRLFATYRYAPIAVSGEQERDDGLHSYRGVWEAHYLGTKLDYDINETLTAIGTFEAGYVLVYLDSVDGLPVPKTHESNNGSVALGGGLDWQLFGENAFKAGPRLHAGFGGFTTFQLSAAATFLF